MTRDEYHKSPEFIKLRFLNNLAAALTYQAQEVQDILEILLAERDDLMICDKFTIVERQLRVTSLEAKRLWDVARDLSQFLEPKLDK